MNSDDEDDINDLLWLNEQTDVEFLERVKTKHKFKRLTIDHNRQGYDDAVISAAIGLLGHDRSHVWKQLVFHWCEELDSFLKIALKLDIFKNVMILAHHSAMTDAAFQAICLAIKSNRRLQKVMICGGVTFCRERAAALGAALTPMSESSQFGDLELSSCRFSDRNAVTAFADALSGNKTIHSVKFQLVNFWDFEISEVVRCLQSLPHLRKLELSCFGEGNDGFLDNRLEGIRAIAVMLTTSMSLKELNLSGGYCRGPGCVEALAAGLRGNQHLKILNLSFNYLGDEVLAILGRVLWTCSALQELNLYRNQFTDRGLALFASQPNPSRLRRLDLDFDPNHQFTEVSTDSLLKIIEVHQELIYVGYDFWKQFKRRGDIEHALDMNRGGIHRQEIPLSLWPLLLERVNKLKWHLWYEARRRSTNIVFHLLQGPAFHLLLIPRSSVGYKRSRPT